MDFYRKITHKSEKFMNYICKDPFKKNLSVVANCLENVADQNGLRKSDVALSFVQSLQYQSIPYYQKYAMQTIYDNCGDCSDKSILLAGIFSQWNYDCIFLDFEDHLAVGIYSEDRTGTYYEHRGRKFFYCETTTPGFKIGNAGDKTGYDAYIHEVYCQ
jgi:hypothetical protein